VGETANRALRDRQTAFRWHHRHPVGRNQPPERRRGGVDVTRVVVFALVSLAARVGGAAEGAVAARETEVALPCRPTIACTAEFVSPGRLELEVGYAGRDFGGPLQHSTPLLLKLTVTEDLQLQLGGNGFVAQRGVGGHLDAPLVGAKVRILAHTETRPALAASAAVGMPTSRRQRMLDPTVAQAIAYVTKDLASMHADLNVGVTLLARDGTTRPQPFGALALSRDVGHHLRLTGMLEVYAFADARPLTCPTMACSARSARPPRTCHRPVRADARRRGISPSRVGRPHAAARDLGGTMHVSRGAGLVVFTLLASACGPRSAKEADAAAGSTLAAGATRAGGEGARDEGGEHRARRGHAFEHVLLLSVDGLHAVDLARFVSEHPASALARLSRRGVTYTAARAPTPSDSFPGLLAIVTGGTPRTTGVYYDDSYDRTLFPPGSGCAGNPGTEVVYDETVDHDLTQLFSGGIDPVNLPLERTAAGECRPVFPHQFLKVNTVFEVVREAGLRTAWSDKHPAYDLVNGPSGRGVEDLYTPEINSNVAGAPVTNGVDLAASLGRCDATNSLGAGNVAVYTDCGATVEAYDDVKVQAILNQIAGKRGDGSAGRGVPALFGMNFQAVSVAEKLPVGGYLDAAGQPSALLAHALAHTDASLGRMVEALEARGLLASTLVVVSAKHGQSPVDRARLQMKKKAAQAPDRTVQDPLDFVNAVDAGVDATVFNFPGQTNGAGPYAVSGHLQTDDVGILWLQDRSAANVAGVVDALRQNAAAIHATALPAGTPFTTSIVSGAALAALFGDPSVRGSLAAARAPDVFIQPDEGVIYSNSTKKIAEHGGAAPGDVDVALLVSAPGLKPRTVDAPVATTQVAPTILEALGLEPEELQAVRAEHVAPLPHLHF
jgi:type I phosphodiesterase/nucleotide pyrophosphatase